MYYIVYIGGAFCINLVLVRYVDLFLMMNNVTVVIDKAKIL